MSRARRSRRVVAVAALISLAAVSLSMPIASVAAVTAIPGAWSATGSLAHARGFAPAVLLKDGTVITAGGTDGSSFTATAERWTGGTWSSAGSIGQAVAGQVAALLPNGKALFAGGADAMSYYTYGDLFDPVAGTWTQTPAMAQAHAYGVSSQLANGDVLVIGGYDGGAALTTGAVDVYSASGGTWSAGPALPGGRYALTATTLADGRVLVAGGDDGSLAPGSALSSVQIYTSGSGWVAGESMKNVRLDHAAVLLADGRVLVAGGTDANGTALKTAEVYDPTTGHWTLTGPMLTPRAGFTMTVLPDGRVVAAGGYSSSPSDALAAADLFDPTTGGWTTTGPLSDGRRYQAATSLGEGSVLVVGGHGAAADEYLASAEVYTPPPAKLTYPATTFHPLTPTRILDSRYGNGLSGAFYPRMPRRFQVSTRGGVPAGDNRANNVTVALDSDGQLSVVYVGSGGSTHAIFDVTGYFTADDTGATYMPLAPGRLLDSRNGTGLSGRFVTNVARTFHVTGTLVPAGALAVTGNLTLVKPTGKGWAFVGPSVPANPSSMQCSTVNAPTGDTRANGVTVKLADDGTLSAVWVGPARSTADLIFDVTGYFVSGTSGSRFVPLEPTRLVDTRYGIPFTGPIITHSPVTVAMAGRGGIPSSATGISGNLTVTGQTYAGYLTVAPHLTGGSPPAFSTLNFPKGDNRANGFDVSLYSDGSIGVTYEASRAGSNTHFVLDVTGYFLPSS